MALSNTSLLPPIGRSPAGPGALADLPEPMPVIATIILLLALILQFVLPRAAPPAAISTVAARRPVAVMPPASASDAAILRAPIFAPDRRPGVNETPAPGAGPLDGYAAIGSASGRGIAAAMVATPGGATRALRLGEDLDGWRLAAISRSALTFERNGVRRSLTVGAPAGVISEAAAAPRPSQTVQP
jgi:hypothetical protein